MLHQTHKGMTRANYQATESSALICALKEQEAVELAGNFGNAHGDKFLATILWI